MSARDRFKSITQQDRKAIHKLNEAFNKLRASAWSEPMYIPEDLDEIECIELGSVGVFRARRVRVDEERSIWFSTDGQDEYPCKPLLWRRVKKDEVSAS